MTRRKKLLTYKDLFGKRVKIILSLDPGLRDLEGIFYNETLRTIALKTPRGPKVVLKNLITKMRVYTEKNRFIEVSGWDLAGRPHERLKLKYLVTRRRRRRAGVRGNA